MKKYLSYLVTSMLVFACSHQPAKTSDAVEDLEDKYKSKIGSATKGDFAEEFGNAEWCRPQDSGEETCRYYKKKGVKWIGQAPDKKVLELFDEVVADFDSNGKLKDFKAKSQR